MKVVSVFSHRLPVVEDDNKCFGSTICPRSKRVNGKVPICNAYGKDQINRSICRHRKGVKNLSSIKVSFCQNII